MSKYYDELKKNHGTEILEMLYNEKVLNNNKRYGRPAIVKETGLPEGFVKLMIDEYNTGDYTRERERDENQHMNQKGEVKGVEDNIKKIDDWKKYLRTVIETQKQDNLIHGIPCEEAEIELEPDKHGFAKLLLMSDLHIGGRNSDLEVLYNSFLHIEEQRINVGLLGDIVEGFVAPLKGKMSPVLTQNIPPDNQILLAKSILLDWQKKGIIKFLVKGNHDVKSGSATGVDGFSSIKWKIPVKDNRMILTVKVGKATYKGLVLHTSGLGKSQLNPLHELMRECRERAPWADFIVAGHTHIGAIMLYPYLGKMVPLVKCGCYNSNAHYAVSTYGKNAFIYAPILEFDAMKRRQTPSVRDGFLCDYKFDTVVNKIGGGK